MDAGHADDIRKDRGEDAESCDSCAKPAALPAGARVDITETVLIGRAPQPQPGDNNPTLMPVPSPNSDISRTHVKVSARDWEVVASDLHSTNGTMLIAPGEQPRRLVAGESVVVPIGSILDLGDGAQVTVSAP